ncbi:MAG: GAF domain-containing protein [Nitrospirae bacterium]|nr:GAF domain-containing protein [Nitrospirota bacterium]
MLDSVAMEWNRELKPMISEILRLPRKEAHGLVSEYGFYVHNFVYRIDDIARFLEDDYREDLEEYDIFRLYVLVFYAVTVLLIVLYIRRSILKPIAGLKDVTSRIKKGDFDARAAVKQADEIGELSQNFNQMSQSLGKTFSELKEYTRELLALSDSSNVIAAIAPTEDIYDSLCNIVMRNFDVRMAWIGLIENENFSVRPVAQAGFEEGYLSSVIITWDDSPTGMGPTGMAIKTKSPRAMNHMDTDSSYAPWRAEAMKRGYRSSMALPLVNSDGKVIAVINLYSNKPAFFSLRMVKLFVVFANIASFAIENRLLIKGLEKRVEEKARELKESWALLEEHEARLRKLYELSYEKKSSAKEFIRFILNEIVSLMDMDMAQFGRVKGDDWEVCVAANRRNFDIQDGALLPLKETLCGEVVDSKKPLIIDDASKSDKLKEHPAFVKYGVVSYLGVPVFINGGLNSSLCVLSKTPYNFTEYHLILFQLISRRIEYEVAREDYEKKLIEAKLQAEAASKAKSDFLANMSHELRTPLTAIIGFSEMMIHDPNSDINARHREYLQYMLEASEQLLSLINDLLDLAKIEAGKTDLELTEFSLKELLYGSVSMFKEKAMKHAINVRVEIEEGIGSVIADNRKIKQVLFNLLSNALKFTPDGGSVVVQARKARNGGMRESMEISVTDTGIGISEEDQKKLFQPFEQLDSALTKKHKGTGLGLSICKNIVELHGGRIWLESEPGRGARFTFTIPVKTNRDRDDNE